MASRQTYTFALIKALYDDNQDLLTALRPFFLGVLQVDQATSATEAKVALIESQAMDLPIHVISMCAEAAEKEGLLRAHVSSMGEAEYVLTPEGLEQALDKLALSEAKRRVGRANAFLVSCMKERGLSIDAVELDVMLKRMIASNLESVVGFVAAGGDGATLDVKTESSIEEALADCVSLAARNEPDVYQTLRDLVYGSVVLATLSQGDERLIETAHSPLEGLLAFVDTNWVMGVLGLDTPARNLAAMELARLAKQSGVELRILDFSLDETRALLKFFEDEYDTGRLPLDPQSVFMQMKLKGLKPSDVLLIRSYLVDTLEEHGILIQETGVVPARHAPKDPAWIDMLMNLKQAETPRAALIDLAAIAYVEEKRGRSASNLESARYLFLSCDGRLSRFNVNRMGHAAAGTYPEVVLDKTLATLLWLKNPGLDIPVEAVVAAHSRRLLHRQAVWHQVVEELARAANSGGATREDISIFLASSGPEVIAEEVDGPEDVTPQVIERMLVQAKREHEEELETIKLAVRKESDEAVAAVKDATQKSLRELEARASNAETSAARASSNLTGRVEVLEKREEKARGELLEQAKTRSWIWAFIVPALTALTLLVILLSQRSRIETKLSASDFTDIVFPAALALIAIVCTGLGALTKRLVYRGAEKRINELFR